MAEKVENQKPRRRNSKSTKKEAANISTGKGTPWTFPKNTLEDAIRIAQAIEEKMRVTQCTRPISQKVLVLNNLQIGGLAIFYVQLINTGWFLEREPQHQSL